MISAIDCLVWLEILVLQWPWPIFHDQDPYWILCCYAGYVGYGSCFSSMIRYENRPTYMYLYACDMYWYHSEIDIMWLGVSWGLEQWQTSISYQYVILCYQTCRTLLSGPYLSHVTYSLLGTCSMFLTFERERRADRRLVAVSAQVTTPATSGELIDSLSSFDSYLNINGCLYKIFRKTEKNNGLTNFQKSRKLTC
jgi:hypothetical protein